MNLLAIDTSTDICSVCLAINNIIIDCQEKNITNNHSKFLPVIVDKIIQKNKIKYSEIDYFILSIGPGSYSGLKVGSSFVKGLAFSQNKPIIPINTIELLNFKIEEKSNYYVAIYSHRDYVYYQEFLNNKPIGNQLCKSITNLKKIKIYGYNLNKINGIKFIECIPSARNLITYIQNNNYLLTKSQNIDITPIYLSIEK